MDTASSSDHVGQTAQSQLAAEGARKRKTPEESGLESPADKRPRHSPPANDNLVVTTRSYEFISARAAADAAINAASMLDGSAAAAAGQVTEESSWTTQRAEDGGGSTHSHSCANTPSSTDSDSVNIRLEPIIGPMDTTTSDGHDDAAAGLQSEEDIPPKEADDEDKKIFVGGLSWDTTENDLFEYFARFGVVSSTSIKYDAVSGNPRGFGFVVFCDAATVDKVLNRRMHRQHWIRGRPIEPKRAKCRPMSKKVFVGGIDYLIPEESIRSHFEQFGKVLEIELPRDHYTNRRREFGFVVYDCEEAAERAAYHGKQFLGEHEVDVKRAMPQPIAQHQKRLAAIAHLELAGVRLPFGLSPKQLMTTVSRPPAPPPVVSSKYRANDANLLAAALVDPFSTAGYCFDIGNEVTNNYDIFQSAHTSAARSTMRDLAATNLATQCLLAQASLAAATTAAAFNSCNSSSLLSMAAPPPPPPASVDSSPSATSPLSHPSASGWNLLTGAESTSSAVMSSHDDGTTSMSSIPTPTASAIEEPEKTSSKIAQELLDAMKTATAVLSTAASTNDSITAAVTSGAGPLGLRIKQEDTVAN